jgi:hypothetical protein
LGGFSIKCFEINNAENFNNVKNSHGENQKWNHFYMASNLNDQPTHHGKRKYSSENETDYARGHWKILLRQNNPRPQEPFLQSDCSSFSEYVLARF